MRTLLTGVAGQLGRALAASAPAGWAVRGLGRDGLDIVDARAVEMAVRDFCPELIVNAAAHTAVDRAEAEPDLAMRINRDGAANLAFAAAEVGARLIHVSTDFVFDGRASTPYRPDAATGPLSVYGASKCAGEVAVTGLCARALIVRTGWVYSGGSGNFLTTMLRLMNSGPEVRVVADQVGTPTAAPSLARALWALAATDAVGVLHFADAGLASWYDFAQAIAEEAAALALIPPRVRVTPIATADYPTPATRPAFSVLDRSAAWTLLGGPPPHWRPAARAVLRDLSGG